MYSIPKNLNSEKGDTGRITVPFLKHSIILNTEINVNDMLTN